jgi:hypothetical protein
MKMAETGRARPAEALGARTLEDPLYGIRSSWPPGISAAKRTSWSNPGEQNQVVPRAQRNARNARVPPPNGTRRSQI